MIPNGVNHRPRRRPIQRTFRALGHTSPVIGHAVDRPARSLTHPSKTSVLPVRSCAERGPSLQDPLAPRASRTWSIVRRGRRSSCTAPVAGEREGNAALRIIPVSMASLDVRSATGSATPESIQIPQAGRSRKTRNRVLGYAASDAGSGWPCRGGWRDRAGRTRGRRRRRRGARSVAGEAFWRTRPGVLE
ncbi:hypothetical protein LY76DRAFT_357012 [Colletotrichum caudatum]|nr:hypothetical protein LY76DRAFT_357012 [Colletotrichum caudatum]